MPCFIVAPFCFFYITLLFVHTASADVVIPTSGLRSAIEAAVNNHPSVQEKIAELESAGFDIKTAESGRYPTLSGQVGTSDNGDNQGTAAIEQPVWAFGKIDIPIQQAEAEYKAARISLLQIYRELIENTAAANARVQGLTKKLKVADDNIVKHQQLFERIKRRQKGKMATDADMQLALSRLMQARVSRETLLEELEVAIEELRTLTLTNLDIENPEEDLYLHIPEPVAIRKLADAKHADILYDQEKIELAKQEVAYEKIASTPTVLIKAGHEFLDFAGDDRSSIGLFIEGSVDGLGLGIAGRVNAARSNVQAAKESLKTTRNKVNLRINSLLSSLKFQDRIKQSQLTSITAVAKTLDSYLRQYETGRKSWLEVLNMQRELTNQRLGLVQTENDYETTGLRICALIGELDEAAGVAGLTDDLSNLETQKVDTASASPVSNKSSFQKNKAPKKIDATDMQETQGAKRIKSLPSKPETVTAVRNETVQADTVATDDALSKTVQQDNDTIRSQGITTAIINLRNEPGLDGHVIRVLKKGIPLTIIGKSGNWYQIPTGYIYADYVLITNN